MYIKIKGGFRLKTVRRLYQLLYFYSNCTVMNELTLLCILVTPKPGILYL
jgi:hypothetical protein